MIKRSEASFIGSRQRNLYYQRWQPESYTSTFVVTHGLGEHSDWYDRFAKGVGKLGWEVFAWDLAGHGRSEGKRGHIENFQIYLDDLNLFVTHLKSLGNLQTQFVLLGHSMGGLISTSAVMEHGLMGAQGLSLSSPLFGVALEVPWIKEKAASILYKYLPDMTLHNEISEEALSRDTEIVELYKRDHLRHKKISPTVYHGMKEFLVKANAGAESFMHPLYIQAAGRDRVVSLGATEKFFERVGSAKKELKVFSNCFHEIYNDLERDQAYADLDKLWRGRF